MGGEYHARKFREELALWSIDKVDPVSEWSLDDNPQEDLTQCICTKDITMRWPITNKITGRILWIGADCAVKWLKPTLLCKSCKSVLGNIKGRLRDKNFYCRSCLFRKKKAIQKRISILAGYRINGQRFDSLSENALNYFINLEETNKTIEYLKEYVDLVYETIEVIENV